MALDLVSQPPARLPDNRPHIFGDQEVIILTPTRVSPPPKAVLEPAVSRGNAPARPSPATPPSEGPPKSMGRTCAGGEKFEKKTPEKKHAKINKKNGGKRLSGKNFRAETFTLLLKLREHRAR